MSTLLTIRNLLADQLDYDDLDATSDPSTTLLNTYINKSIRKIIRRDRPQEMLLASPISANIVSGANTVAIPATVFVVSNVYYQRTGGTWVEVLQKRLQDLIQVEGVNGFFDTTNTGEVDFYSVRGGSLVFNKYFNRSATGAIKIFGVKPPTDLTVDASVCELPSDYDLLIAYESAVLFYQKDDDETNQLKFQNLAIQEKAEVSASLDENISEAITLDPYVFTGVTKSFNSSSVFFS
jgi:hypothetical protein